MTNENVTLPLLPLKSGVVLPGMVFTMALESDEARVAVEAARSAGGRLLLVPHIEGRYASVGVIAEVMEEGDAARRAARRRHPGRPARHHRYRRPGDRRRPLGRGRAPRRRRGRRRPLIELAREYRAVLENISAQPRRAASIAARCVRSPSRAAWPTWRDTRPTSRWPRRSRCSRRSTSRRVCTSCSAGPATRWPTSLLREQHQDRRRGGHGEDAARVPAAPPARGHQQGARSAGRRATRPTPTTTGPRSPTAICPSTSVPRSARDRQARAHQRSEPGDRVGSAPGSTPCSRSRGASSPTTASTSGGQGASSNADHDGLEGREGPHPRAPGRAKAPGRTRTDSPPTVEARGRSSPWSGPPASARRRSVESVANALGAQVRPRGLLGRRARRGGDPGTPPYLRGRPARTPGARATRGRDHEPGHRPRRGRQARLRLPRRPLVGAARGARPGAEPHVP